MSVRQVLVGILGVIIAFFTGIVLMPEDVRAQAMNAPWILRGGELIPALSSWGVRIPSLASEDCIGTDADGSLVPGTCGAGGGLANVIEDTSPQLGGDLDFNDNDITSVGGTNVAITKTGAGSLTVQAAEGGLNLLTSSGNGDITINPHGTGDLIFSDLTSGLLTVDGSGILSVDASSYLTTVDISDDTNLAVSSPITLTGDTVGINQSLLSITESQISDLGAYITDGNTGWDNTYNLFDRDTDTTDNITEGTTNLFSQWDDVAGGIEYSTDDVTISGGSLKFPYNALGTEGIRLGLYGSISESRGGLSYIQGNALTTDTSANNQIIKTANDAGQHVSMRYDRGVYIATNLTGSTGTTYSDSANARFQVDLNGNVMIGGALNSATEKLTVTGNGLFSGSVTANSLFAATASSTNLVVDNNITFDGVTGNAWSDFCTAITGGAGLCDGSDDGAGGGSGTVTSVAMTVPTGLSISGSPITSAGTLALSLTGGYNIPLTASTSNWNTAFGWGDHGSVGYGDVSKVGTPVNNELGVWTGDGTLEGESGLLFNPLTSELDIVNGTLKARDFLLGDPTLAALEGYLSMGTEAGAMYIYPGSGSASLTFDPSDNKTSIGNAFFPGDATLTIDSDSSSGSHILDVRNFAGNASIFEVNNTSIIANATTSFTNAITFDGVTGNAWSDFCVSITGSADLCDGSDGGGGSTADTAWATSTLTDGTIGQYPVDPTVDVLFGASATSGAGFWYDASSYTTRLGAGGAGDSIIELAIDTVTKWVFGADDSTTNDDFVISRGGALGTTNSLVLDGSTGNITTGVWNGTAIDVSDYTNLAVTSPIVLTGDTLSINQSLLTITESQISDLSHFSPSTLLADYSFTDNSTNWNTAFGWGDHSLGGYLTTVDISANTNLAGDAEIVLTGDSLSLAASVARDSELPTGLSDLTFDVGSVSATEFGFLNNVTSAIQTQLNALGSIAGQVWTGLHDFGAAVLEIPNGTAPVANDPGELAFDTTDNQLIIDDFVIRTEERLFGFTLASTSPEFVSGGVIPFPREKDGFNITEIHCYVEGGTSVVFNVSDGTNDTETVTCNTSGASDTDITTNDTFTAGELAEGQLGTISGTPDYLSVSVFGTITRE